ncbi:MAG: 2-C-methyl-D-erythritol 4-phosphate cytidylyltransferase, partial [Nitrospirae bacterium]|nr:2-C-methyl-D-erythritol 4-phosphate cytidylyltransferase [Fimbriimonadaceae bacterium]
MKPRVAAIVLAAGRGERFGADKVNLSLGGKPVWRWSFEAFLAHPEVDEVGLVCAAEHVEAYRIAAPEAAFVVAGGASRQESSELGVQATQAEIVLVHDFGLS